MKEIYQSSVKEVLGQMGSREEGLTIKEVEKSRILVMAICAAAIVTVICRKRHVR